MAEKTVRLRIVADDQATPAFQRLGREMERTGQQAQRTNSIFSDLGQNILGAITIGGAIQLGSQLYNLGREASIAASTFTQLSGGASEAAANMDLLRLATGGIVDDMTLMQGSSKLLQMGLATTGGEVARLTELAVRLGGAMGSDATSSIENFALLLANQSVLRLDTFGISSARVRAEIERLMATGEALNREDAFRMAVLSEGAVALDRLGAAADAAGTPLARLQARFENMAQQAGIAATNIIEQAAATVEMLLQLGDLTRNLTPDQIAQIRGQLPPLLQGFGSVPNAAADRLRAQREAALAAIGQSAGATGPTPFPQGLYGQPAPTTLDYTLDTERIRADMIDRLVASLQMPFMRMGQLGGGVYHEGMFASQEDANTARALYAEIQGALQSLQDADVDASILEPMTRAADQAREIRDYMVEGAERLENMDLTTALMPAGNPNELLTGIFEGLGIDAGTLTPKQREQMLLATGQETRTSLAAQQIMAQLQATYGGADQFNTLFNRGLDIEKILREGRAGGASEGDIIRQLYGVLPTTGDRNTGFNFNIANLQTLGGGGVNPSLEDIKRPIEDAIDVTKQFDDALNEVTSQERKIELVLSVNTSAIPKAIMDLIGAGALNIVGAGVGGNNGRTPGQTNTGGASGSTRPIRGPQ